MSDIDRIHSFLFNNLVVDASYKLESNVLMKPDCDNKYNVIMNLFSKSLRIDDNNTSFNLSTDYISLMKLTHFFIYEQYFNRYIKLVIDNYKTKIKLFILFILIKF
jgi:hypothetical protein